MPWGKRIRNGQWQVINKETGRVVGTHPTEAKADAQLAALHIHVKK